MSISSLEATDWEKRTWERLHQVATNEDAWSVLREARQEIENEIIQLVEDE